MSPERFQGHCDARGGRLLSGLHALRTARHAPAFESTDRMSLISQISSDEPARPRTVDAHPPRLGNDCAQGHCQGPGPALPKRQRNGRGPSPLRRWRADQSATDELVGPSTGSGRDEIRLWRVCTSCCFCGIGSTATAIYLNGLLRESEVNRLEKEKAEQRAIEDLYASYVAQANASRFSRRIGQRFATLEAVRRSEPGAERGMPAERIDGLRRSGHFGFGASRLANDQDVGKTSRCR